MILLVINMIMMFQIIVNKFITFICKLFKRNGTVFPGSISYNINQKILGKIRYPKYVIAVTGSSGKGTATNLIAHTLKDHGYDVCYNESDSNGIRAITTLILNNCTIFGKFKHDILLMEIDEKHLHLAFTKNRMSHLVLTNITRDQPVRNGSIDLVYNSIFDTLDKQTTLVINADDPGLKKCEKDHLGTIITYGLARTKDSYIKSDVKHIDYVYCPICRRKLNYSFYHYGHFGNYFCKYCDFGRGNVNYEGTDINLEHKVMKIENHEVKLNEDFLYVAYANVAAYALLKTIGVKEEQIVESFNKPINFKRTIEYNLDNRKFMFLESKNENNLSYYQSLKFITKKEEEKTIVLGFENVSRRYKSNDLSWLWDIEFELLNQNNITDIVCIGKFKYDLANRLDYARIPKKKIHVLEENENLSTYLKNHTTGTIYAMLDFEMTINLQKDLRGENNGNN